MEFETEPMKISKDTRQFDYKVTTRSPGGQVEGIARYRAVITVATLDPVQEDIKDNPLGIYITNFDIKELH